MAIIINIDNVVIQKINIDYELARVEVYYALTESTGIIWRTSVAYFWATLPTPQIVYDPNGNPIGTQELPENWYQLPQAYIDLLINMRNDADAAITARVLGG